MGEDRGHGERRAIDLSQKSHSVDGLDGIGARSGLDIVSIEASLLDLHVATPDTGEVSDKLSAVVPDVACVCDPIGCPQLDGAPVVRIVLGVEESDLEFAAVGTLNRDVELLSDVLGVDLENLDLFASVMVAGSLFFGSFVFH